MHSFIFGCFGSSLLYGLSLVAVSAGYSWLRHAGFLLQWLLSLRSTGSRHTGSVVTARGLRCSVACGVFPACTAFSEAGELGPSSRGLGLSPPWPGGGTDPHHSETSGEALTFLLCLLFCAEFAAFQAGEGGHSGNDSETPPEPAAGTDDG